jgi:allene oxide cyclase
MAARHRFWIFAGLLAAGLALHIGPASAGESFKLVERATSDTVTDLGKKGDTAGDLLTFTNEIYDQDNKKLLGTDNGWCIRTAAGKAWECFWTVTLPNGQITVEGPYYDDRDSVLAVTGGTGAYATAKGEMNLHARDAKGSEYDFSFLLVE